MKKQLFRRIFVSIVALITAFTGITVSGQIAATSVQTGDDASVLRRMESFEKVWTTVNEKHYDPTFGGVDWNAVRERYEPLARNSKTDDELHNVLRSMLGELKLSHFGIYPIGAELGSGSESGSIGVELKLMEGEPVVFRVDDGSGAKAAGIMPGMTLRTIDGKLVSEILAPLEKALKSRDLTDASRDLYRERAAEALLRGDPQTKVTAGFSTNSDEVRNFSIERKRFAGELSQPLGNFPAQEVVFELRLLEGNIGYFRFNMWVVPQMPKLRAAMKNFAGASGLIVDLRGNPGGVGGMASGLAGLMLDQQATLGSMRFRENEIKFIVYPQSERFTGPIVVLIDHGSGSTSEIFAAGLQELGRATVIGKTSAGAVLPSLFDTLPTNARFQFAIADYRSPTSVLIEGRGVFPDIDVDLDRKALIAGRDSQLEKAIEILKGKTRKN
ncbi:S41 family peptidase [soil metagenome]